MAATLNNLAQATCGMCDKHPRLRAMLAGVVAVADLRSNDWHARLTPDGKSLELVYVPQGTTIIFR